MDLDALRKAALQTKKRKRALAHRAALAADDLEEGEIDNLSPPPPQPPVPPAPSFQEPAAPLSRPAAALPPAAVPSTVPLASTPQALHAIKEESKAIIAELLTYGVPPDYLLSIGVSRDILEISFHELNLDLTLPPPAPQPLPFAPPAPLLTAAARSAGAPFVSPAFPAAPPPIASTSRAALDAEAQVDLDLAALEARKRAELLARKAALKARNQQRALSLESELDSLFSSSSSSSSLAAASILTPGSALAASSPPVEGEGPPSRKRAKLDAVDTGVRALRHLVDAPKEEEEVVDSPEAGPFAAAGSVAHASTRSVGTTAPPSRRPVATDLEAEPTNRMSDQALVKHGGGPAYLARMASTSMIIELSDSEDDTDAEPDGNGDVTMRATSPSTSVRPLHGSAQNGSVPEGQRRQQLLDKDRELQRLKDRIAALERKQRAGSAKRTTSAEPEPNAAAVMMMSSEGPSKGVELPGAVVEEKAERAEERVSVAASETVDSAPHEPEPAPAIETVAPSPAVQPVFRPYRSALSRFPLCRTSAFPTAATADSSTSTSPPPSISIVPPSEITNTSGSAGVASWAARKHGVDTSKRLCKAEASGGKCSDGKCKAVHVAQFRPTDEELAEYESLRLPPPPPAAEQKASSSSSSSRRNQS